jgi:hypothetical protein
VDPDANRYGSGSFHHQAKTVRKPLISTVCDFFGFFSLKNDVNVPSKYNNPKNLEKNNCVDILNVTDEKNRIRSRIRYSEVRIRIRTKMSRIRNTDRVIPDPDTTLNLAKTNRVLTFK